MTTNEVVTLVIATASLVVAGVSALFAKQSADTSRRQLALIERKVGMVTDPSKMTEVLPVWYVDRMGQDNDRQWLELDLLDGSSGPKDVSGIPVTYAGLPDRKHGSVRVDQVQAAFELWTS